jgi:hypothetical protein
VRDCWWETTVRAGRGGGLEVKHDHFGILEDNLGIRSKVSREVADRHRRAVNSSIVAAEEQVHVSGITNDGLIDGTKWCIGNLSSEQRLRLRPTIDVGRVIRSPIRELGRAPLMGQDPNTLRSEIE